MNNEYFKGPQGESGSHCPNCDDTGFYYDHHDNEHTCDCSAGQDVKRTLHNLKNQS